MHPGWIQPFHLIEFVDSQRNHHKPAHWVRRKLQIWGEFRSPISWISMDLLILLWIWYDWIWFDSYNHQYPTKSYHESWVCPDVCRHIPSWDSSSAWPSLVLARSTLGEINPMVMWNPALMVKFPMNIYEFQSAPDFWLSSSIFLDPHGWIHVRSLCLIVKSESQDLDISRQALGSKSSKILEEIECSQVPPWQG